MRRQVSFCFAYIGKRNFYKNKFVYTVLYEIVKRKHFSFNFECIYIYIYIYIYFFFFFLCISFCRSVFHNLSWWALPTQKRFLNRRIKNKESKSSRFWWITTNQKHLVFTIVWRDGGYVYTYTRTHAVRINMYEFIQLVPWHKISELVLKHITEADLHLINYMFYVVFSFSKM